MNNALFFLNPDLVRRHKGVHLSRRLQKPDRGGQRKRLKWKTHQQAKNIIKQNWTSIFARMLAFRHSKKTLSLHLSVYKGNVKSWNPSSLYLWKQLPGRANPQTRFLKKSHSPLIPLFFIFLVLFCLSLLSLLNISVLKKGILEKKTIFIHSRG